MYTIGELCRQFQLSRSTLLYYSKLGLLTASQRTEANYRQYTEEDKKRLARICAFREAGIPLRRIKEILNNSGISEMDALQERLCGLNQEIRMLRLKQQLIAKMLEEKDSKGPLPSLTPQAFTEILQSSGMDAEATARIHTQFEKNSPDMHQLFLEFLGFSEDEIIQIREYYAGY